MEEFWPTLLCRIVLIQPHWRVFKHERNVLAHATASQSDLRLEFLGFLEPFRGGRAGVFGSIVLLQRHKLMAGHSPSGFSDRVKNSKVLGENQDIFR